MVVFIEARYNFSDSEYSSTKRLISEILKKNQDRFILLSGSIQYLDIINKLSEELNLKLMPKHDHSCYDGQVLGCSFYKNQCDVFINIVDGLFHSKILKINNPDSIVYNVDISNNAYNEITDDDVQAILNTKKSSLTKFHYANKIGIIVNQKPGQKIGDDELEELKKYLEKHNKEYQVFLCDSVDLSEFDNFNYIDYWINTACPRLSYDDAVEHKRLFAYYKDIMVNSND